ncbi:MAG: response regulator [Burkholderiales bacterium]|jgi:DNA-binding response OmpR family regulator|nr:response regulator [Burkholderiales bacterium]
MRLLLIEDDLALGASLQKALSQAGFAVEWVRRVADARGFARQGTHDLVLLDIGLPDGSGLDLLREWRTEDATALPVILLTARDSVEDRVGGLDLGADDYVPKPFATTELVSRIHAVLRRRAGFASQRWQAGAVTVDVATRAVTVDAQPVDLSPREFALVLELVRQAGRVVPRHRLERVVFPQVDVPDSNALDVHIHHVRRKLGAERIRTVRGVGFMIAAQ